MKKRTIITFGLIAALTLTSTCVAFASPQDKVDELEQEKAALESEISGLDQDLVDVLVDINIVKKEIKSKKQDLKEAQSDLQTAQDKEAQQYDDMKKRIRYMYENGQTSYLSTVLESKSFADVLNKVKYFKDVYTTDRQMLNDYQETVKEVENLVDKVTEEEGQLQETKENYEEEKADLNEQIETKQAQVENFDEQLVEAKRVAAEYYEMIHRQNQQQNSSTSSNNNTSSSSNDSSSSDSENISQNGSSNASNDSSSSSDSEDISESGSETSSSGSGDAVADYACSFEGNPYVWGGTSLTHGCDCSGFVMAVYAHFGVSLPHSSDSLRSVGRSVSVSDIQPGDIVCYSGHVGIYAGGGSIINASNSAPYPKGGIKYTDLHYRSIICVRRIF